MGWQVNCQANNASISASYYLKGDDVTGHGEFVESMENGNKNVYKYQFSGTHEGRSIRVRDQQMVSHRRWRKDEGR
jgi:hypothetical protein